MTGVMPVAGSRAKSSAMTLAEPRRNAYGEEIIRPIRIGTSHSCRPAFLVDDVLDRVGSAVRRFFQKAMSVRCERSRSDRPSSYRSLRGRLSRRNDV